MKREAEEAQGVLDELQRLGVTARNLCADSRAVAPGDVFVAYPGARADGRGFIADAVARGAAAVLWERQGAAAPAIDVPNVAVDDLQALSGWIAHRVYGRPSEQLWTVGVTGTNGKTSVSQWIAQAFELLGRRCAVVGTLGCGFPGGLEESLNTTPDALTLHRLFARYLAQGAQAAAMEVSSIGLDQGRVNGVHFDVAVFTNLTRDHLEYHGSMAAYGAAKERLFATPGLKAAVVNLDDDLGRRIARDLAGRGVAASGYSLRAEAGAQLVAERIAATPHGQRFTAVTPQGRAEIETPLVGEFNVANLLAVLGALLASDVALIDAAAVLRRLTFAPGRMQAVGGDGRPLAVIDYAHTPDALDKALAALRGTAAARGGRLVCVFGCGGNRDPGKRPLMGEAAARGADAVILTSDNPRDEDPRAVLDDIARGAPGARMIADRAEAIRTALAEADARDVVLVAGKGHEAYQEIAGRRLPFSDADCAAAALAARHPEASS
ncbi:MAG: UDP-N-acetylmuramoyl-L-alanyl-D-glutamate--2,6-diaminopimelate ligase [Rhodocyclaceae bacterium]|nr:UDP-N-acetylmuramoyl-L-alanyl-D-glutamate--2,6-diaminopimelate ligase [Rhodocyclaceae bacterium]MCL4680811.1 UDP-N-acetylmuramoyl-L-alanyl-D-glutamate--2,6-diaminopimelate ligase [Rhodocyclaceae bacterium]